MIYLGALNGLLSTLSVAILRSAWVEPDSGVRNAMWHPLLTFLKGVSRRLSCAHQSDNAVLEYPNSWELEAAFTVELDADNDEDNDEDEDEQAEPRETPNLTPSESKTPLPHAYEEFRQFL